MSTTFLFKITNVKTKVFFIYPCKDLNEHSAIEYVDKHLNIIINHAKKRAIAIALDNNTIDFLVEKDIARQDNKNYAPTRTYQKDWVYERTTSSNKHPLRIL